MKLRADQERVKTLICDTLTLLCKNGLKYDSEFSVEALIGITLDRDEVFLVNIKETVTKDHKRSNDNNRSRKRKPGDDQKYNHVPNGNYFDMENSLNKVRRTDVPPKSIPDSISNLMLHNPLLRCDVNRPDSRGSTSSTFRTNRENADLSEASSENNAQDLSLLSGRVSENKLTNNNHHIVIQPESHNVTTSATDHQSQPFTSNTDRSMPHMDVRDDTNSTPTTAVDEALGAGPAVWPSAEPSFAFDASMNLSTASNHGSPIQSQVSLCSIV